MFLVLSLLLLFPVDGSRDVYAIIVEPQNEECFYEDLEKGDMVRYEYHVVDGESLDIEIRLFYEKILFHKVVYLEGKDLSSFSFNVSGSGPHAFCFNNEISRVNPKTVLFSLETIRRPVEPSGETPFEKALRKIGQDLEAIEREQGFFRVREHMHRNSV
eukprot:TRINITY_DN12599_c0_g1_i1.p1 TRINITY_DN12599_c0_g1~~TRINITY_DN12599_c0_g1_i1.p1  ORF type:complete len:159 (+),score=15.76 TRINITY_DN12599_c0_g1_i1:110-586(+)